MIPAGISVSVGLGAAQVADLACSETTHFLVEEWINDRTRLTEGLRDRRAPRWRRIDERRIHELGGDGSQTMTSPRREDHPATEQLGVYFLRRRSELSHLTPPSIRTHTR